MTKTGVAVESTRSFLHSVLTEIDPNRIAQTKSYGNVPSSANYLAESFATFII